MTNGVASTLDLVVIPNTPDLITNGTQWIDRSLLPSLIDVAGRFRKKTGRALYVAEGFRSLEKQRDYFFARYYRVGAATAVRYDGSYWAKRSGVAVAAVPGTSNHGLGIALDLWSGIDSSFRSAQHLAFAEIAIAEGWVNTGTAFAEPWHWQGTPTSVVGAGSSTPIPLEDDMSDAQYNTLLTTLNFLGDRVGRLQSSVDFLGDRVGGGLDNVATIADETRAVSREGRDFASRALTGADTANANAVENKASLAALTKQTTQAAEGLNNLGKTLTKVWGVGNNIASKVGAKRVD